MKRPIKFRGKRLDNGEFIYGDLRIIGIYPHIFKQEQCYYDEELIEVDPESVAQLVGFDANGNEVYEGDFLVNDNGDGFFAELVGAVITDEGFLHADIPPEILKLKEATK